jgi:ssRNA-specific RNase YbeY (16S rRNA maturation enzyme)
MIKKHLNPIKFLGDIVICPKYMDNKCQEDYKLSLQNPSQYEQLWQEDRGISRAMMQCFTIEERWSLILIHGMLHLLGYDHETSKDWIQMTQREEELLQAFQKEIQST